MEAFRRTEGSERGSLQPLFLESSVFVSDGIFFCVFFSRMIYWWPCACRSYERHAILEWFARYHERSVTLTSPMTGEAVRSDAVTSNYYALKSRIQVSEPLRLTTKSQGTAQHHPTPIVGTRFVSGHLPSRIKHVPISCRGDVQRGCAKEAIDQSLCSPYCFPCGGSGFKRRRDGRVRGEQRVVAVCMR